MRCPSSVASSDRTTPRSCSQARRRPSENGIVTSPSTRGSSSTSASRRSMAAIRSSRPSPVSADTACTSSRRASVRRRAARISGDSASILFQTSISATSSSTPRLSRISPTSPACSSVSGWLMSRTCRIRSASSTSSSVARKAATSCVGRSLMKPTVSDRMILRPLASPSGPGRLIARMVGSRVANSMSLASTSAPVRRLNSVDLPALV